MLFLVANFVVICYAAEETNARMKKNYVHGVDWLHKETDSHTSQLSPRNVQGLGRLPLVVKPLPHLSPSFTITQVAHRMEPHLTVSYEIANVRSGKENDNIRRTG